MRVNLRFITWHRLAPLKKKTFCLSEACFHWADWLLLHNPCNWQIPETLNWTAEKQMCLQLQISTSPAYTPPLLPSYQELKTCCTKEGTPWKLRFPGDGTKRCLRRGAECIQSFRACCLGPAAAVPAVSRVPKSLMKCILFRGNDLKLGLVCFACCAWVFNVKQSTTVDFYLSVSVYVFVAFWSSPHCGLRVDWKYSRTTMPCT